MTTASDGAFPCHRQVGPHGDSLVFAEQGLTKREWFAGLALQGLLAHSMQFDVPARVAALSCELADALIAELAKEPTR